MKDDATLDDFKELCEVRLKVEREELTDGFISPESPHAFQDHGVFGMFYSGGDHGNHRIFSTYLSLKGNLFMTLYLEGLETPPEMHAKTFQKLVKSLKR